MPNANRSHEPDSEPTEESAEESTDEPEEPLNRAERRAQRRGKKAPPPPTGGPAQPAPHERVVVPRRSGRRGNR